MSLHTNQAINTVITQGLSSKNDVFSAIKNASQKTGVSFDYLVDQARAESNFQPEIKSKTSSATGLYQFINSTWLNMINKHGDKYGLGEFADKISDTGKVASKADKQEILNLRKDPQVASYMAAEFAKENQNYLQNSVGGQIGETDLYLAHFLGAGGAGKFLKNWQNNPNQPAADIFPQAAKANKNVFYDRATSKEKSLDEVYQFFAKKFDGNNPVQVAENFRPAPVAQTPEQVAQTNLLPTQLQDTIPASLLRLAAPQIKAPILSPYTNMILAALDVPGVSRGEGSSKSWFSAASKSYGQSGSSIF